mmetsp:Transcript_34436/g.107997  ORF Transcript_34436/g.107997 Transcript_34436/m.107997 type:complete len:422 (-) Transcript_34436:82-1347(-)
MALPRLRHLVPLDLDHPPVQMLDLPLEPKERLHQRDVLPGHQVVSFPLKVWMLLGVDMKDDVTRSDPRNLFGVLFEGESMAFQHSGLDVHRHCHLPIDRPLSLTTRTRLARQLSGSLAVLAVYDECSLIPRELFRPVLRVSMPRRIPERRLALLAGALAVRAAEQLRILRRPRPVTVGADLSPDYPDVHMETGVETDHRNLDVVVNISRTLLLPLLESEVDLEAASLKRHLDVHRILQRVLELGLVLPLDPSHPLHLVHPLSVRIVKDLVCFRHRLELRHPPPMYLGLLLPDVSLLISLMHRLGRSRCIASDALVESSSGRVQPQHERTCRAMEALLQVLLVLLGSLPEAAPDLRDGREPWKSQQLESFDVGVVGDHLILDRFQRERPVIFIEHLIILWDFVLLVFCRVPSCCCPVLFSSR